MDIVGAAHSSYSVSNLADVCGHLGVFVRHILAAYHVFVGCFQVCRYAMNSPVALQDSLFQACSGGMCFLQVHIRLQFQVKISFQSPIDLAHMNIMGVYAL